MSSDSPPERGAETNFGGDNRTESPLSNKQPPAEAQAGKPVIPEATVSGPKSTERGKESRFLPAEKAKAVMRVLRGESQQTIASELDIPVERLNRWQAKFYNGGVDALERKVSRSANSSKSSNHVVMWVAIGALIIAGSVGLFIWLLVL